MPVKAKLIIHTGYKGGPDSGNYGHSGRPGKVGGSAQRGKINYKDYAADVHYDANGIRGYWIDPKDKLIDVTDIQSNKLVGFDVTGSRGSHWDALVALGLPGTANLPNKSKKWDYTTNELEKIWDVYVKAQEAGYIRIADTKSTFYGTTIETMTGGDGMLHRLQGLFYAGKLFMNAALKHIWNAVKDEKIYEFSLSDFLIANHARDLKRYLE
jgi:hypothetical protein